MPEEVVLLVDKRTRQSDSTVYQLIPILRP